jgi:hypothetical protein
MGYVSVDGTVLIDRRFQVWGAHEDETPASDRDTFGDEPGISGGTDPISSPWVAWELEKPPAVVGTYDPGHMTFGQIHLVYVGSGSINRRIRAHSRDPEKTFEFYRCSVSAIDDVPVSGNESYSVAYGMSGAGPQHTIHESDNYACHSTTLSEGHFQLAVKFSKGFIDDFGCRGVKIRFDRLE